MRWAVQRNVIVVGSSVGSMNQPFALPSTSVGGPSDPVASDAVHAWLYPSPSTTQHPSGHGDTSTVRPVRDVEVTVTVGAGVAPAAAPSSGSSSTT